MIHQEELEAIIEGRWTIECPSMSLTPANADIEGYQGAGYIEQTEEYRLRFKLISAQKTGFSSRPEPTQSGQLYALEEYWALAARDIHGREWVSKRILPEVLHDEGTVATGDLRDLNSSEPNTQADEPHAIKLWFLGDFKVTYNQPKLVKTIVGDEEASLSGEWNHGKFTFGQRDFFLKREQNVLFLEVRDPARKFQPFYADRVEESLEFVLGQPACATVQLKSENFRSLQVRSVAPAMHDAHAKPPYPPPIKDSKGYFWYLFSLHLKHIAGHNLPSRSPLSRVWQYFIDSRKFALEIRALSLGVGVEALLKLSYPVTKSDGGSPQREAAENLIIAAELDGGIRRYLLDALKGMGEMSPKNRLYQLVERGVISQDQFKAWKQIRNRAAHAGDFAIDDETIRNCNLVLTAAHRMSYDVLGYEGAYKDYGTPGWPELNYPAK